MIIEQAFDFGRVDVLAAADNHVFGPAKDPQAFLVKFYNVTGGGPALGVEYGGSQFFITIVTGRCMGAPEI